MVSKIISIWRDEQWKQQKRNMVVKVTYLSLWNVKDEVAEENRDHHKRNDAFHITVSNQFNSIDGYKT